MPPCSKTPSLLRLTLVAAAAGLVLLAGAGPAGAGGTSLYFDQTEYLPGQTARAEGGISITDSPGSGWIDDGPYYGYLIESERYAQLSAEVQQWPYIPAEAISVGEVRAQPDVGCCSATFTLDFVVPSLARGRYTILICNEPCTATLGDYTSGGVAINAVGAPPLTEITAPDAAATPPASLPATAEPASASSSLPNAPENNELQWWWPVAAIGFAGLVVAMTIRRTRTHSARAG